MQLTVHRTRPKGDAGKNFYFNTKHSDGGSLHSNMTTYRAVQKKTRWLYLAGACGASGDNGHGVHNESG